MLKEHEMPNEMLGVEEIVQLSNLCCASFPLLSIASLIFRLKLYRRLTPF